MSRTRILVPLAAAAILGAAVPVSTASADPEPAFSGYTAGATAAPVAIAIYEPTIPIPADPQLELDLAYTTVDADSGSSAGRASWLWPGDSVGEGLKTFVEQIGLPPQLGENGYPVQVNASRPSGADQQADEPLPGMVMRASAGEQATVAQAGFSPDGQVQDGAEPEPADSGDDGGGDGGTPVPGLGELPALPALPGLPTADGAGLLSSFGEAITGGQDSSAAASSGDAAGDSGSGGLPGLPPELAALIDVEGVTSSSSTQSDATSVHSVARAALGDVSLLGGLVTLEGVTSVSRSVSDGTDGRTSHRVAIGGVTVAGQEFSFGPDGFEAAGQHADLPGLPGLPGDPAAALAKLGVALSLPQPVREIDGDAASGAAAGLQVELDLRTLKQQLSALPLGTLVDALPSDPPELKSAVQALTGLAPRIVVTLGSVRTDVDTVQGIEIPTVTPPDTPATDPDVDAGAAPAPAGGGSGGGTPPAADTAPAAAAPAGAADSAPAAGDLPAAQLTGSGLPPLYSLPGALLVGGIALAAVGGTWLRRIGVIALGGGATCSHGLDSGLPDLRKAP